MWCHREKIDVIIAHERFGRQGVVKTRSLLDKPERRGKRSEDLWTETKGDRLLMAEVMLE